VSFHLVSSTALFFDYQFPFFGSVLQVTGKIGIYQTGHRNDACFVFLLHLIHFCCDPRQQTPPGAS
jgi:hypothetical protein